MATIAASPGTRRVSQGPHLRLTAKKLQLATSAHAFQAAIRNLL